jgi:hypothetical protein
MKGGKNISRYEPAGFKVIDTLGRRGETPVYNKSQKAQHQTQME